MNSSNRRTRPDHWAATWYALILRVGTLAALAYLLYRVGQIIVIVLAAAMLALVLARPVDWLRRSRPLSVLPPHLRRGAATAIVFALVLVGLVVLMVGVARPLFAEIKGFLKNWRIYQEQLVGQIHSLQLWYQDTVPQEPREWMESQGKQWFRERGATDLGSLISGWVQHLTGQTRKIFSLMELVLIPVLAWSFLTESRPLKRELTNLLPRRRVRDGLYVLKQSGQILQSYAVGQLILAAIAGFVVYFLLSALRIPGALALALVAAVTRVIPVIGPLVGGVPIVLVSTSQGWQEGLLVLVLFTILHLVESKVVMPKLIGYRINLHPALVIIALLVGAEFFGMWGMFLAAPVAAVLRALLNYFFVQPHKRGARRAAPPSPPVVGKEPEVERPTVAGVRTHSGVH